MARRESSAGLYLVLAVVAVGALAASIFFAPLSICPGCAGHGWTANRDVRISEYYREICGSCDGNGRTTLARAWFGRR